MSLPRCPSCARVVDEGARFCGSCGAPLAVAAAAPRAANLAAPAPIVPEPSFSDSMLGRVLNERYRVVRKIGQGGFGTVYEGVQLHMDRAVALKVLHPRMTSDPQLVARFRREARAACNLRDAHTIVTYDFDQTEDGILYLVMELLKGRSLLQDISSRGSIVPGRAVFLIDQVCSSLAEAHAHAIVHRDIKPENIFIEDRESQRDYVKVLDFGIAKIMAGEGAGAGATARLTASGQTLGTLEYMSPEQLAGSDLDGRSDIYSVGIMLYQMLTGALPFAGTPTAVIAAHLNEQPKAPSRTNPAVPPALDAVVLRSLAKHRAQRFPDMAALRGELGRVGAVVATAAGIAARRGSGDAGAVALAATAPPAAAVAVALAPTAGPVVAPAREPGPSPSRPTRKTSGAALALVIILVVVGVLGGIGIATHWYLGDAGGRPKHARAAAGSAATSESKSGRVRWQPGSNPPVAKTPAAESDTPEVGGLVGPAMRRADRLERFVPTGTTFVLQVEPRRLFASSGFGQSWNEGMPVQLQQAMQAAGINLRGIEEALFIAPTVPSGRGNARAAVVTRGLDGSFLRAGFLNRAQARTVRGVQVLVRGEQALASLEGGTLLMGHPAVVEAALDATAARSGGLAADDRALLDRVRSKDSVGYALLRPDIRQIREIGRDLKLGEGVSLHRLAAALAVDDDGLKLDLMAETSSPAAASHLKLKAEEALAGARADQDLRRFGVTSLLQKVRLSSEGDRVVLKVELETATLKSFAATLQQQLSGGFGAVAAPSPRQRRRALRH